MRARGFTLIEVLVALFVLGTTVFGVLALWSFAFNTTAHSQDLGVAYNIARKEIEKAHNLGYMLIPAGTWTVGYDGMGQETNANPPHYTVTLDTGEAPPDSSYLRTMTVTVVAHNSGRVVFETETHFSRGGV